MERRRFIELGAIAGASATSQACLPAPRGSTPPAGLGEFALRRRLRWLDRLIGSLGDTTPRLLRDHEPRALTAREQVDAQLTQSTLRSLLLTGSIADLPEQDRLHPEVMARLEHAAPEVDYALYGMMTRLSAMPADEHDSVERGLREDPDLVDRIGDFLDQDASDLGVPLRRRLHMRRLVRHVGWRMQRQSLSTVLDEHLDKVQRLTRRAASGSGPSLAIQSPPVELSRWSGKLEHLLGLYGAGAGAAAEPPDDVLVDPIPSADEADDAIDDATPADAVEGDDPALSAAAPEKDDEAPPGLVESSTELSETMKARYKAMKIEERRKQLTRAGVVLGVGVGIGTLSGVLISASIVPGAIGLTAAAILLIIGLIMIAVRAVQFHRANKG